MEFCFICNFRLNTNIDIYRALQKVVKYGDNVDMDCVDKRVANLFLFDFEQSGIHLNECQVTECFHFCVQFKCCRTIFIYFIILFMFHFICSMIALFICIYVAY